MSCPATKKPWWLRFHAFYDPGRIGPHKPCPGRCDSQGSYCWPLEDTISIHIRYWTKKQKWEKMDNWQHMMKHDIFNISCVIQVSSTSPADRAMQETSVHRWQCMHQCTKHWSCVHQCGSLLSAERPAQPMRKPKVVPKNRRIEDLVFFSSREKWRELNRYTKSRNMLATMYSISILYILYTLCGYSQVQAVNPLVFQISNHWFGSNGLPWGALENFQRREVKNLQYYWDQVHPIDFNCRF